MGKEILPKHQILTIMTYKLTHEGSSGEMEYNAEKHFAANASGLVMAIIAATKLLDLGKQGFEDYADIRIAIPRFNEQSKAMEFQWLPDEDFWSMITTANAGMLQKLYQMALQYWNRKT